MAEIIYLVEQTDNHLFKVVRSSGQVCDEVDILSAEGMANRLGKQGYDICWIDKYPTKERKRVNDLIAKFKVSYGTGGFNDPVRAGM